MSGHSKWSDIKRAKAVSDAGLENARAEIKRAEAAWAASRRMIARGERPLYRVETMGSAPDIHIRIVELPWLTETNPTARGVLAKARTLVAEWLDVDRDAFDVARS